ncbi:MAG TPA: hypothetical protein VFZ26_16440, partial [Gemmatimonadales bacterium]
MRFSRASLLIALVLTQGTLSSRAAAQTEEATRLVGAMLGDTPLAKDLEALTDRIGGRPTGSPANLRSVEWALERFRAAGVEARREPFRMPGLWLERSASASVRGDGVGFSPRVAALPFSTGTPAAGVTAPLVEAGKGSEEEFGTLGSRAKGAFVLIETAELEDLEGLFHEYTEGRNIEERAIAAGARGLVYMSSRPNNLLAR